MFINNLKKISSQSSKKSINLKTDEITIFTANSSQ